MKSKLKFKVLTPDGVAYSDDVLQVTVLTESGVITVAPQHEPLVSVLKPGELLIKKDDHDVRLFVAHGCLEVRPGSELVILADQAERAEAIDLEAAEAARTRAEEMLKVKAEASDVDFARLESVLERELARVKVGRGSARL